MSPLAAKADCAERTTNNQQKSKGLPSVPITTKDRLLQSTQSLSKALPQDSLNTQQHASSWIVPMTPSSVATDSDVSGNGTESNSLAAAVTDLHHGAANGVLPVQEIGTEAMPRATTNKSTSTRTAPLRIPAQGGTFKEKTRQRQRGYSQGVHHSHNGMPSSRSVRRLRAILRKLRATAQANGTRVKICLTAKGLARAKAALLTARATQQAPIGQATTQQPTSRSKPRSQKPEPVAANTSPKKGRGSVGAAQSKKTSTSHKTNALAKGKVSSTKTKSSDEIPDSKASQGPQKRLRHAAQSLRTGSKGVYTEDSIRVYLQEIGRIRLLRPDEEIELARKIADLLYLEQEAEIYFHENERYPSTNEWAELVSMPYRSFKRRLKLGRRAKEKMVQSNLRLVVSIAKKYMNRGLSFQDLIQEGSLGLVRAAEKFDHEKGYKFSTYATWWIRQAITRAIADQSRTIRLPVHLYETISRIKKSTKTLSQELGRKPSEEEIAERMEMTIEKLRFIAKSAQLPISLETPIGKEEDSRLGDFIESDTENPDQDVAKNLLREDLESVLATLSPRERDVLRLRYGLDDGRMKTLEDIGQIFEVTRERIRQIEAKALRKLRHPNRNGVLKEYIK